jgi:deoxycytidine triphosphate deaminase
MPYISSRCQNDLAHPTDNGAAVGGLRMPLGAAMKPWMQRIRRRGDQVGSASSNALNADSVRREELRSAANSTNKQVNYAAGDDDAAVRFHTWRERDPYPGIPAALLNSADIVDYVAQTGMIYPFYPERLKPASYEVALLGRYLYVDGDGTRRSGEIRMGQKFILKKNSIAFVSVEPYFRLPDYIALRHNLKISNVYKGLLVGTGPLVDPGFVGRLSLPLHNLTNQDYEFQGGDGIIWIEFTKLSPNRAWSGARRVADRKGAYTPFPIAKTELQEVGDYVHKAVGPGEVPSSSIAGVAKRARRAERTANRTQVNLRRAGLIGAIVGAITILIAAFAIVIPAVQLQQQTNTDLRAQQTQIANLQQEVKSLQAAASSATKEKP